MSRLTLDTAKAMPFEDLVDAMHAMVDQYEAPGPNHAETEAELTARLNRSIDELPDVYGFLNRLHSMFDHWTDAMASMHGLKGNEYKWMRQRRDAAERAAKSAKLRYEGASRHITVLLGRDDESRMPRGRG